MNAIKSKATGVLLGPTNQRPLLDRVRLTQINIHALRGTHDLRLPTRYLAASLRDVIDSPTVSVIMRILKKLRPTQSLVLGTVDRKGRIIATGGTIVTHCNDRVFATTGRTKICILLRTTINNNVPIIRPLGRTLNMGHVRTIANVVGNAAGCVLAHVRQRKNSFRSVLTSTRQLNCTRTSPSTSMSKLSTTSGVTVLTSLTFNKHVGLSRICDRKVHRIATTSVLCTGHLKFIVGLLTVTHHRTSSTSARRLRLQMRPALIPRSRPLTSIGSICGTVLIRNSPVNRIVFFNPNTKRNPATDTIISSVLGVTTALISNRNARIAPGATGPLLTYARRRCYAVDPVTGVSDQFCLQLLTRSRPKIVNGLKLYFNSRTIDLRSVIRVKVHSGITRVIVIDRRIARSDFRDTLSSVHHFPRVTDITDILQIL